MVRNKDTLEEILTHTLVQVGVVQLRVVVVVTKVVVVVKKVEALKALEKIVLNKVEDLIV